MNGLKKMLLRFPVLYKLAILFRFLVDEASFASWVWIAPKKFMDKSHLRRTWDFESSCSQEFHNRVLAVIAGRIGGEQWGDALEIGYSEGVFTSYLATRCRAVDAYDISPVARMRATERCAKYPNVRIELLDLAKDEIPGQYDLVFAMDILSCVRGRKRLTAAAKKLVSALRDGGILVYTDNSMPLDILRSWGSHRWWGPCLAMMEPDDCVQFLKTRFCLQLVYREQYLPDQQGGRDQMIALFQKGPVPGGKTDVESVEEPVASVALPVKYTQ